ncbi:MAG: hypothetical protein V2I43_05360 [Parvularcula sp.]|jgi:hypothetical protein|nr:hypothetical protein [Parvularcula sp.]
MTDERPPAMPARSGDEGGAIVARRPADIAAMSDEELLGEDYDEWLGEQKNETSRVLSRGQAQRSRAEFAMRKAEASLEKAKACDER